MKELKWIRKVNRFVLTLLILLDNVGILEPVWNDVNACNFRFQDKINRTTTSYYQICIPLENLTRNIDIDLPSDSPWTFIRTFHLSFSNCTLNIILLHNKNRSISISTHEQGSILKFPHRLVWMRITILFLASSHKNKLKIHYGKGMKTWKR